MHIRARCQQGGKPAVAVTRVQVQGRSAPDVHRIHVRTGRQERVDDIFTTSPEQGRCSRPVSGVDLRTGLQERGDDARIVGDVQHARAVVAARVDVRAGLQEL